MSQNKSKILYVDDEIQNLNSFKASFRREYDVLTATNAKDAMEILSKNEIHVIISDQRMPEITGIEFLESILHQYPFIPRILLTGYADIDAVIDAINRGSVYRYIQKPWNDEELKLIINSAIELYLLNRNKEDYTEKLIISNEQMEFLLRQNLLS